MAVAVWLPRTSHREPLRVAIGLWPGAESLVLARERGQLPEDQFRLVEMTWASAAYRAFDNGVVDAAVVSLDGALRLRQSGEKLRVVFVMDVSKGADAVMVRGAAATMAELKGRRVGVDVRGTGMHLLSAVLASEGMKMEDVEVVPLLQPEMEAAFAEGEVDAVVASEPWVTVLSGSGVRILSDSSSMSPPVYRVLVVAEHVLAERPEDLVKLLRAHLSAMKDLREGSPGREMDAIARREGLSLAQFSSALGRIGSLSINENRTLIGNGATRIVEFTEDLRETTELGKPAPSADVDSGWADSSILEALQP
jgi:NitT/TauT family transport system substrate-binding protein